MIALLTDFHGSEYAGIVKGVIYSIAPEAKIIDITHGINAFDIRHAAYAVYSSCAFFPANTIFLTVVDPGVGTQRECVIIINSIEGRKYCFVGPNNGIFSLIEVEKIYRITEPKLKKFRLVKNITGKTSKTFHARDIFAPAAALLELGTLPEKLGNEIDKKQIVRIMEKHAELKKSGIEGEVICCDSFGNIITSIKAKQMSKKKIRYGRKLAVSIKNKKAKMRFLETYGYAAEKEVLCLINSADHLEIARKNGSAQKVLKVKGGEKILVSA